MKRRIPSRTYQLRRGLPRFLALKLAHAKDKRRGFGDHRGFKYDAATGRAMLT